MRRRLRRLAVCAIGILSVSLLSACAAGGGKLEAQPSARTGGQLFKSTCAACHGADARGAGPVAPLLNVEVPDLTHIAARRHGEFPELQIFRIIDGQAGVQAHGTRHMPVWGYEFFGDDVDDEAAHKRATDRIDSLVAYLQSIQRAE